MNRFKNWNSALNKFWRSTRNCVKQIQTKLVEEKNIGPEGQMFWNLNGCEKKYTLLINVIFLNVHYDWDNMLYWHAKKPFETPVKYKNRKVTNGPNKIKTSHLKRQLLTKSGNNSQ